MTTPPQDALPAGTLADAAYQSVRSAIGSGELCAGTKVTERGLAQMLQMSATPVREAIRRLELDGLIERQGPRTLVVAQINDHALGELIEVEVALRGVAARFAARHATQEEVATLDQLLDEADDLVVLIQARREEGADLTRYVDRVLDLLHTFNTTLDEAAHNPVLMRLLEQSRTFDTTQRRQRTAALIMADESFAADRYAGHRAIVAALRARDAAKAERLVTDESARALLDLHRS